MIPRPVSLSFVLLLSRPRCPCHLGDTLPDYRLVPIRRHTLGTPLG